MPNLLDSTNVHPEAYKSARELIRLSGAQLEDLGKPEFQAKINSFVQSRGINFAFTVSTALIVCFQRIKHSVSNTSVGGRACCGSVSRSFDPRAGL